MEGPDVDMEVLPAKRDRFNGRIVDMKCLERLDVETFSNRLRCMPQPISTHAPSFAFFPPPTHTHIHIHILCVGQTVHTTDFSAPVGMCGFLGSLDEWRKSGVRGVHLTISLPLIRFLPPCLEQGFSYHHARKQEVSMTHWLQDEPFKIPVFGAMTVFVRPIVLQLVDDEEDEEDGEEDMDRDWNVFTMACGEDRKRTVKISERLWIPSATSNWPVQCERVVMEEYGVHASFQFVIDIEEIHGNRPFGRDEITLCVVLMESKSRSFMDDFPCFPEDDTSNIGVGVGEGFIDLGKHGIRGLHPKEGSDGREEEYLDLKGSWTSMPV
jgi:hypothetical protein